MFVNLVITLYDTGYLKEQRGEREEAILKCAASLDNYYIQKNLSTTPQVDHPI